MPCPLVPVQTGTGTDGPPRGRCAEPRQEGLWSRLVAPTGTNRHPLISISVAGVFVFFERRGGGGFWGVNLGVSYIVLAAGFKDKDKRLQ